MDWPIFTLLAANASITALVGTNPVRVWEDTVPDDLADQRPYIVWGTVGGAPENYMGDLPGIDSARLQVDVYSTTKAQARALAKLVRNTLESSMHMIGTPISLYEPDTKLHRYLLEFQIWQNRT